MADDTGSLTNLAQIYTAAREARAEHPDESRFQVAMRGIAAAPELSDPLFPLRKKIMEQQVQEQAITLSNQLTAKQWQLEDATTLNQAAQNFAALSPADKINFPTPAFKTPQAQAQWTNFMKMNLGTAQVDQAERMQLADQQYKLGALAQLDPEDRASIGTMSNPAMQMQALTLALERKEAKTLRLAQEAQDRLTQGRIAVAQVQAQGRLTIEQQREQAMAARSAAHDAAMERMNSLRLSMRDSITGRPVTKARFIQQHFGQVQKALDTKDADTIKQWMSDFYDKAIAPNQEPVATVTVPPASTTAPAPELPKRYTYSKDGTLTPVQ